MLERLCYLQGHAGRSVMNMLAADMGGTQSRFYRFSCEDGEISIKEGVVLPSSCISFEALLAKLVSCWPEQGKMLKNVSLLIFAAAGPVRDGRIVMTNASFSVEKTVAEACFRGAHCLVMNDFEAQAWACLSPAMEEAVLLLPGRGVSGKSHGFEALSGLTGSLAPVVVTGAGTGLGAAWLLPGRTDGEEAFVLPSEAGHMAFPFEGKEELGFADFLEERRGGPVTAEHVLSGPGLALLYEYLCGRAKEPACFTQEPGFAESSCCRLFARFYGRFCRTAALSLLPQAVVVTGGVAGRTPSLVRHPEFAREFLRAKGGQRELLSRIPVWLNRHPLAGLWGAARAGVAFAGGLCRAPEEC